MINGATCVFNGTNYVLKAATCVFNGTNYVFNGTNCVLNGTNSVLNGPNCLLNEANCVLNEANYRQHFTIQNRCSLRLSQHSSGFGESQRNREIEASEENE